MIRILVTLLLFLFQKTGAFSTGAGGCAGGMAAIEGDHFDTTNGKEVLFFTFEEWLHEVKIGSTKLDASVVHDFPAGQDLQISISSPGGLTTHKGVLIRLEAPSGVNTAAALLPGTNTAVAGFCMSPIIGITHTNNVEKVESTGMIRFDETVLNVVLGITVVVVNDSTFSVNLYNEFKVNFRAAPTPPVAPPVVPPTPVTPPVVPPTPVEPPAVPPTPVEPPAVPPTPVEPPVVPPTPVTPPVVPPTPVEPPAVPPTPVAPPVVPPTPVEPPAVPPTPVEPPAVPPTPVEPPVLDCTITFDLFNALTDSKVATLTNGVTIANPPPCGQVNIEAVVPCGNSNSKVTIELYQEDKKIRKSTESSIPYFLFGNNGSDVKKGKIKSGSYRIRAQVNGAWSPFISFTLGGMCSKRVR